MSYKAILFLVGIFALMGAMAVTVPQWAEAHGDHKEKPVADAHDYCDYRLCVEIDPKTENRIKVSRHRKANGKPYTWDAQMWRIRTLRDTSFDVTGQKCSKTHCWYDDSQKGNKRAWAYDYQCVNGEDEIGVYVQYFKGIRQTATLPSGEPPVVQPRNPAYEVYTHSIKLKVSC